MRCSKLSSVFLILFLSLMIPSGLIIGLYIIRPLVVHALGYYATGTNFTLNCSSPSSIAFQNDINKTVTLQVSSGLLNTTTNMLRIYDAGGYFRFTANNNNSIMITYEGVDNLRISGDQNNELRAVTSGATYTIDEGNNVLIQWDTLLSPLFPLLFTLGISGLVAMFAGPAFAIWKIKERQYFTAFSTGTLVTTLGVALFMAWLWGA